MKYSRTIAGGIAGTILLALLVAAMVIVYIERVERAVGESAAAEVMGWTQDGGESEGRQIQ